jgi:hypothetical protein
LSDVGRRTGVDGVNAGLTGPGTATPSIESRPNPPDEREGAAEGDACKGELEVKAATSRAEATMQARASAALKHRLPRGAMPITR